jgi:hypothetical protein
VTFVITQGIPDSRDPLSLGIDLFWRSWVVALPAALCAVLAGQLPSAYALWQGLPLALSESKDGTWWLLMVLAAVINLWSWLFIMRRLAGRLSASPASLMDDGMASLRIIPKALLVLVVMALLIALGTAVLILPGIYLLVVGWLVLPATATRTGTVRDIIDGCLQTARGQWWRLAKGFLVTVIGILALFVIGNLLGLMLFELTLDNDTLASFAGGLLGAIYMPFAAAMAVAHDAVLRSDAQSSDSSSL